MRVRGFHPFSNPQAELPEEVVAWQDWITPDILQADGQSASFFKRKATPKERAPLDAQGSSRELTSGGQTPSLIPPGTIVALGGTDTSATASGPSSSKNILTLNNDVIAEILAASREMPSWKACEMEGTDWSGTAEENIEKYSKIMRTDA